MKKQKALTLVELLIASSIFGIVIITIYSVFHSGISGYRNIEETTDIYQTVRLILERMNLDLRNSFAYSKDKAKFAGNSTDISFLTLVDTFSEDKILQDYALVSYELQGDKLMRLCRKNQEALDENSQAQADEMAENIEVTFKYGDIPPGKEDMEFKNNWSKEEAVLPLAVKVNLTIKGKIDQKFERTIYLPLAESNNG